MVSQQLTKAFCWYGNQNHSGFCQLVLMDGRALDLTAVVASLGLSDEFESGFLQLGLGVLLSDCEGNREARWGRNGEVDVLLKGLHDGVCHRVELKGDVGNDTKKPEGAGCSLQLGGIIDSAVDSVNINVFNLTDDIAKSFMGDSGSLYDSLA